MAANQYKHDVENTQRSVMREEVRKLLKYLYADQILFAYRTTLTSMCNGCVVDHPSQSQHMCVEQLDDEIASIVYSEAETKVDKHYLQLLFIEACNTLWLNYSLIDFDSTVQEFLQCWVMTDFQDLEQTRENLEEFYVTASASAAMKICSLEERFTR